MAVPGKEMVVDAVGMARWPEEGEEGGGTGLSDGGGEENGPRSKRKPRRGWDLPARRGKRKWSALPSTTERTGL